MTNHKMDADDRLEDVELVPEYDPNKHSPSNNQPPHVERGTCPEVSIPPGKLKVSKKAREQCTELFQSIIKLRNEVSACFDCVGNSPGCCYMPVAVTTGEALEIISAYLEMMKERAPILKERAREEAEHFGSSMRAHMVGEKLQTTAGAATPTERSGWTAKRKPCPFLTPSGKCGVYPVRPWACVFHYVKCPPEYCGVAGEGKAHLEFNDLGHTHGAQSWALEKIGKQDPSFPREVHIGLSSAVVRVLNWLTEKGEWSERDSGTK